MPRFRNTDNGQEYVVADHEALIYESASNFERIDEHTPAAVEAEEQPVAAEPEPKPKPRRAAKKPAAKKA